MRVFGIHSTSDMVVGLTKFPVPVSIIRIGWAARFCTRPEKLRIRTLLRVVSRPWIVTYVPWEATALALTSTMLSAVDGGDPA